MFPFAYPSPTGASGPSPIFYRDTDIQSGPATGFTFTGKAIGPAASDRYVFVGTMQHAATRTVSSMTVGGVSASLVVRQQGGSITSELWMANVPTGTTATIVVTWSGSVDLFCGIGVWSATGLISTTPVATGGDVVNTDPTLTLSSTPGGFGISVADHPQTAGLTLTGDLTQDYQTNYNVTAYWCGGSATTSGSTCDIQWNQTFGNVNSPYVGATFF